MSAQRTAAVRVCVKYFVKTAASPSSCGEANEGGQEGKRARGREGRALGREVVRGTRPFVEKQLARARHIAARHELPTLRQPTHEESMM